MFKRLIPVAALLAAMAVCASAEARPFTFLVPVTEGLSVGSTSQLLGSLAKVIEKKTGFTFKVEELKYRQGQSPTKSIISKLDNGSADFSFLFSQDYIRYKKAGGAAVIPQFTMLIQGKPYSTVCAYTRKSDGISNVAGLKGKRWAGSHTVNTRYLMHVNKFDAPMAKFFSSVKFFDDINSKKMMDNLLANKYDVFVTGSFQVDMIKANDKKYEAVATSGCTEFDHNWIFVSSKSAPKDVSAAVKASFLRADKDKDFAQFKFVFAALKGKFVEFDPALLKTTENIVKLANDNGWYKEENDFIKTYTK